MHTWIASVSCVGVVADRAWPCWRTARAGPGGRSRWRAGGRARRRCAGRGGSRGAASGGPAAARRASPVDRVGLRARARASGAWSSGSPATHPHARLALGARLGEQQGAAVGEAPPGLAEPRLGGLLLVGLQAPALHEVHDEGELAEVEQQVLAPPADEHQLAGRRRRPGPATAVFSAVKASGGEALERRAGEGGVEPLGVGLDLGELRHRAPPSPHDVVEDVPSASSARWWITRARRRRRASGRP